MLFVLFSELPRLKRQQEATGQKKFELGFVVLCSNNAASPCALLLPLMRRHIGKVFLETVETLKS
jgi:hypothetical protein